MTEAATSFDFRKPCRLPITIENRLIDWHTDASKLIPDKWSRYLPFEATMSAATPETMHPADYDLPNYLQAYRVKLAGYEHVTLMGFSSVFCLMLVEGVLGNTLEQAPEERRLTSIESALLEVVIQLLLDALNEAAINSGLPTCSLDVEEERPHLIRLFPGIDDLVMLRLQFQLMESQHECVWFWPESLAHELFPGDRWASGNVDDRRQLEQVAQRIPFDLSIRLGSTSLDVSDLAQLSVGDVIVLDQRVAEPLDAHVAHQRVLRAWPGQHGKHRAIQIETVMDS